MQSGITASQELLDAFKDLVSTSSQRGIITVISGEQLTIANVLSAHGSFESDLSQLDDLLTIDKPAYVILRRYEAGEGKPEFVMVTYVPDAAKVREKTLVASTRNTLLRELGTDRFAETIFATTKAELTAEGFKKHDSHVANPAPLTEEERVLGEVRRLESEVSYGTAGRKSHVQSGGVSMPISPEALFALKSLNTASTFNLVQLTMDMTKETIELDTCDAVTPEDLHSKISNTSPRYSFYVFHHEFEGEQQSPIVFIYTCPSGSKIKERMVYATCKRSVVAVAEKEAGIVVAKNLEAASAEEITVDMLMDEFHPKVEAKKAFARPKRPGRR